LSLTLTEKLNNIDFNAATITANINTISAESANLNAWLLRDNAPSTLAEAETVVVRDVDGNVNAATFTGSLLGNADSATYAQAAQVSINVTGIIQIANGGTGAITDAGARNSLKVIGRDGDTMLGTLVLNGISTGHSALRLQSGTPSITLQDGDVWYDSGKIKWRDSLSTFTVAPIESPTFTGMVSAPTATIDSNSTTVATTAYVQLHRGVIDTALNTKAPIGSPTLTGDPKSVTPITTNESTSIATTQYVINKITAKLTDHYTKTNIDNLLGDLDNSLSADITAANSAAQEALNRSGLPVGAIMYFTDTAIPAGWLKANGALVTTAAYPKLFQVIGYKFGGSGAQFMLPDLRGEFLRGADDGRGIDPGRAVGSWQKASVVPFDPSITSVSPAGLVANTDYNLPGETKATQVQKGGFDVVNHADYTNLRLTYASGVGAVPFATNAGGWEVGGTRPRNVALVAFIKAFGAVDDASAVNSTAVLNTINEKVDKAGDTMTGYLKLPGAPIQDLHAVTKKYVDDKVSTISLTPGPQGATGLTGSQGPQGVPGTSYDFTSGIGYVPATGYTNQVGQWNFNYNFFDVFPPGGKTMGNLRAFIPSIQQIHFAGGVNGDDSIVCHYSVWGDRIRVYVQNTEQRAAPAASWLAVWS
jgi:microcystin-dependent protein